MGRRRPVIDFGGAQMGDPAFRDAVGGNIQHGAEFAQVARLIEYMLADKAEREARELAEQAERRQRQAELDREFQRQRDVAELYRVTADQRYATLQQTSAHISDQLRVVVAVCVGLGLMWLLGFGLLIWLLVDSATAISALKILAGTVMASAAAWKMAGVR
jgi:hypothetical protein